MLDSALTHNAAEAGSVHLAGLPQRGEGSAEVHNTGPYVDDALMERPFEPFYRARSRISRRAERRAFAVSCDSKKDLAALVGGAVDLDPHLVRPDPGPPCAHHAGARRWGADPGAR
ncbi:hypothetical protein [Streptomyces sp. NPDC051546]|uniref:hypothetical protein n=1 Tax=Streptomyces sp. NPDC051546 TaxID=3365655 RepID=UPI0037B35C94